MTMDFDYLTLSFYETQLWIKFLNFSPIIKNTKRLLNLDSNSNNWATRCFSGDYNARVNPQSTMVAEGRVDHGIFWNVNVDSLQCHNIIQYQFVKGSKK